MMISRMTRSGRILAGHEDAFLTAAGEGDLELIAFQAALDGTGDDVIVFNYKDAGWFHCQTSPGRVTRIVVCSAGVFSATI